MPMLRLILCGRGSFWKSSLRLRIGSPAKGGLVGERGKIVAVDIEPKMLEGLCRRARREGVLDRVDVRQATPSGLGLQDLDGRVDFALAFAVIHELPDQKRSRPAL